MCNPALTAVVVALSLALSSPGLAQDSETEDEGRLGNLSAGIAYNSAEGAVGNLKVRLDRFTGEGRSLDLSASASATRYSLRGAFHMDEVLAGTSLDLILRASRSEPTGRLRFGTEISGIEARLSRALNETTLLSGYLGTAREAIDRPQPGLSAVIAPDVGTRNRSIAGLDLRSGFQTGSEALAAINLGLGLEASQVSNGVSLTRVSGMLGLEGGFAEGRALWSLEARAGSIAAQGGSSSIGDRFILGGGALRGFAYGGFGPRDGTQPLGGNAYSTVRLDVRFPTAFGEESVIVPGLHLDGGSLWDLSAPGAIDDSHRWRSSAGVTLSARAGEMATINLSLSRPMAQVAGDETELFQLNVQSSF